MLHDDTNYYRQRAATERDSANASEQADVRAIHEELARQYEALVQQSELRPTPHLVQRQREQRVEAA